MFNGNMGGFSLADIAAAVGGNRNNNGWGNDGGWWIIVLLMAMWGGFGDGNWGTNGSNRRNVAAEVDASLQRGFDTQTVINKLNGIENGICGLGYDQLAQMNNLGTQIQGVGTQVMQTGFGITQAINTDTVANMQNTNALSRQIGDCCCDMKGLIKDLQFASAQEACATQAAIHQVGDNIINSQSWGFRNLQDTVRDGFAALERQNDQRYIQELERKLNTCDRDTALMGMANHIINTVQPRPVPAYPGCNPNGCGEWAPQMLAGCRTNNCCDNRCC